MSWTDLLLGASLGSALPLLHPGVRSMLLAGRRAPEEPELVPPPIPGSRRYALLAEREGEMVPTGRALILEGDERRSIVFEWGSRAVEELEGTGRWPEGFDAIIMEVETGRRWAYIGNHRLGWDEL